MDTSNNSVDPIDMLFEVSDGDDKAGPSAASTAKSGVYESFYDKSPLRNVGYGAFLPLRLPFRQELDSLTLFLVDSSAFLKTTISKRSSLSERTRANLRRRTR